MGALQTIPIGALRESGLNPRRKFGEAGLDELAQSMRENGVLQPLIVRPVEGGYEIGAGHRRFRAAARAGLEELPAIVRPMEDGQFLELLNLENLHRENLTAIEECLGYQELLKLPGYDVARIAEKIGKSISYVYQRLKLADLIGPAQEALWAEEITPGHAILIARLQPADQQRALETMAEQEPFAPMSVRDLAAWIDDDVHRVLDSAPFPRTEAFLEGAPACAECPKRTGAQPELYADGQRDCCVDPVCYERKAEAWVSHQVGEHPGAEKLSSRYHGGEGVRSRPDWTEVVKGAGNGAEIRTGILVDGPERGKLVRFLDPHQARREDAPGQCPPSDAARLERARIEREKRLREIEKRELARHRIADAILEAFDGRLRRLELEFVALDLFGAWARPAVMKRRKWKLEARDGEAFLRGLFPSMSDVDLGRLILECALDPFLDVPMYDEKQWPLPEELKSQAARHGIDAAAIEREVLEGKPAAPKKPEARKAPPAARPPAKKAAAGKKSAAKKAVKKAVRTVAAGRGKKG